MFGTTMSIQSGITKEDPTKIEMQKEKYHSNLNTIKLTPKMETQSTREI